MATNTPNYNFILPGVNDPTDQDLWGGYLNSNLSAQDSLFKTAINWVKNEQSSNYVLLATDINKQILCDATAVGFNVTLLSPATAGDGYAVMVKKIDSSANAVTIVGTIDGGTNYTLADENDFVLLVSDGVSGYYIYSKVAPEIEFASAAEVEAGTVSDKAVAPDTLKDAPGFAKAWANVGSTGIIARSYRVTNVSAVGTGLYNVTLADTYPDTSYMVNFWSNTDVVAIANKTTTGFQVQTYGAGGSGLVNRAFSFIVMDT